MELTGTVQSVNFTPYTRDSNGLGFHAFVLKIDGGYNSTLCSSTVMCKGHILNISVGDRVKLQGEKDVHKTRGIQFKIDNLEFLNANISNSDTAKFFNKTISNLDSIRMYLSSGIIKGIGESLARRIVDTFGEDTFKIIEEDYTRLEEVKGITLDKAKSISEKVRELQSSRDIVKYLLGLGISRNKVSKIYEFYKDNTINILKENPYKLITDIGGFAFKTVDKIALSIGLDVNSLYRIKSGIMYTLELQANTCGNVYMNEEDLITEAHGILTVDDNFVISTSRIQEGISELLSSRDIFIDTNGISNMVYITQYYEAETIILDKLLTLSKNKVKQTNKWINKLEKIEKELNITLSEGQRECIKKAFIEGVLVITGGAGTGKTTVINTIVKMFKSEGYKVDLCTPTGRSAKRLQDATNLEVNTIHRLLGVNIIADDKKTQRFIKNSDNTLDADVVIVDEVSMVDNLLMSNLLQAIDNNTKLILVGDANQLASVGAGNVLKDILESNKIDVVQLKAVYRQDSDSHIVLNADKVNKGEHFNLDTMSNDFFFIPINDKETLVNSILDLVDIRITNFAGGKYSKMDIQVLSPFKKDVYGTVSLNKRLQERLNPYSKNKSEINVGERIFREHDKVMQIKNNIKMEWVNTTDNSSGCGVFNGDLGVIKEINTDYEVVTVLFDDGKEVSYRNDSLDELDLAYAITIHKSQGSEYKVVILPIHSGNPKHLTRNLLYTGITRAKEMLVLVGIKETVYKMIDNLSSNYRNTYLKDRIVNKSKFCVHNILDDF